jgi:hypothetical protein
MFQAELISVKNTGFKIGVRFNAVRQGNLMLGIIPAKDGFYAVF